MFQTQNDDMETNLQQLPKLVNREVEKRVSIIQSRIAESFKAEKELMEFEILSSLLVKPQTELHEAVKDGRNKAWNEALKKANGNRNKAIELFCDIYP